MNSSKPIHSRRVPNNDTTQDYNKISIVSPLSPPPSPKSILNTKKEGHEKEVAEEAKGLADFFTFVPQESPPSSIPGSPEYLKKEFQGEGDRIRNKNGIRNGHNNGGSNKNNEDYRSREVPMLSIEGLDRKNTLASPILPKVKLAFPTIMSDEDEPVWNGLSHTHSSNKPRGISNSDLSEGGKSHVSPSRNRTWSQNSQTTTTTTTTRKKTEHRTWRYSMPAFDALSDEHSGTAGLVELNPRSHSSHGGRSSNSTYSTPNRNSTSSSSSSQIPFPSSGSNRKSSTTSFHNRTPRSTRTSLPIRELRRSSPLPLPFPTSPSSTPSVNPFDTLLHRRPSNPTRTSSYHSLPSDSTLLPRSASTKMKMRMRNASVPLLTPLMNMFMFFLVTSIACCSISAVLVAGFSLTFYDDCGRRVKLLREGIEGVSFSGVSKMIGGAVGEWAKEATKKLKATSSRRRRRRKPRRMELSEDLSENERSTSPLPSISTTNLELEEEPEVTGGVPKYKSYMRSNSSRSRSRVRRKSNASTSSSGSFSMAKRFSNPTRFFPNLFGSRTTASTQSSTHSNPLEDWFSDEDNLPFEVPTSTPHPSRPSSPPPSSPSTSSTSSNTLPPRPPLALLVPSIIFALIFTLVKVTFDYWRGTPRRGGKATKAS